MAIANLILRGGVGPTATIPLFVTHGLGSFSGVGIFASPNVVAAGSVGDVITITGLGTSWTPGTPGSPIFTLSSTGTGASKTAQTVTSATAATITITAGTVGIITVTDPSTGATATLNVILASQGAKPYNLSVELNSPAIGGNRQHPIQLGDTGHRR